MDKKAASLSDLKKGLLSEQDKLYARVACIATAGFVDDSLRLHGVARTRYKQKKVQKDCTSSNLAASAGMEKWR